MKKISLIALFLCLSLYSAAQNVTFNIQLKRATLETIINELRNQSDINFIYNHEELSEYTPKDISLSNASLEEVLDESLKDTNLTYKKVDETIVITPTEPDDSASINQNKYTQTIRGTLKDLDTHTPLIGATIRILETDPIVGSVTNEEGEFKLSNIPIGRVSLYITYIGYKPITVPNVLVNSGKEVMLDLYLQESTLEMETLDVTATGIKGQALDEMSVVSARSISPEETNRYPGGFNDPSRIMSNFTGVTSSQDGNNDIIVRGNSPKYMQWRLEGVQITNPNHFADQNAVGGLISALNNNMLATSDFYTGAFSSEYGDVLSGVYDVKFRQGNNEQFEAVAGIGTMGTDFTVEGPFSKNYNGSYLVNYRYSTLAVASELGLTDVQGIPNYQDASYKIVLPTKKAGTFSLFGLGGISKFSIEDVTPIDWNTPGDNAMRSNIREDYDKKAHLLNTGINHTINITPNNYLKSTLFYSNEGIDDDIYELELYEPLIDTDNSEEDSVLSSKLNFTNRIRKSVYRAAVTYHHKISAKHKIQIGSKYALFYYDYYQSQLNEDETARVTLMDFDERVGTLRNFVSWRYNVNDNLSIVTGLHNMNVLYNNKSTLEPRFSVNWNYSSNSALSFGYGMHSNMESIHNYFAKVELEDGTITEPNKDLDLLKAHHFVLGYEKYFSENIRLKAEVYYQHLYNLPVENNDSSYYSTINEGQDFRYVDLVNDGKGRNYGVEFTIERFFANNYYFLVNTSVYQSLYTAKDGIERNTRYNNNYMVNMIGGKEYQGWGKKHNQTFGINAKLFIGGGQKIIPLLRDENGNLAVDPENNRYWDYNKAYESKLDDFYYLILSVNYKWNKPKATHELTLVLDNITDSKGKISEYYDESEPNSIGYTTKGGFYPNLMYRIYF
ncbi:MAG: TonB-dependent receptor [Thalassobius sp.]|nr:TonB-dependent receptor [Thalassovita sp.]